MQKIVMGLGIGAASGAAVGAVISKGNTGAAALYGAIIFSVVGAGLGYAACGP